MGQQCVGSAIAEDLELYNRTRLERDDLKVRNKAYEESLKTAEEQANLLRFKVEVLVQMLAVEEKKCETLQRRVEACKYLALSQGLSKRKMTELLQDDTTTDFNSSNRSTLQQQQRAPVVSLGSTLRTVDLGGAVQRMYREMAEHLVDIVSSFASEQDDGRVLPSMEPEQFMRHLFSITQSLSKADAAALTMRFYDGDAVCIPEFLEFFIASPTVRRARAAGAAVRVGLQILELQQPEINQDGEDHDDDVMSHNKENESLAIVSCGYSAGLQRAVRRLAAVWKYVDAALTLAFDTEVEHTDSAGEGVVDIETFKDVLFKHCNVSSNALRKIKDNNTNNTNNTTTTSVKPVGLSEQDIDLIAERFAVAGLLDTTDFLHYFRNTARSSTSAGARGGSGGNSSAASPFQLTSEWDKLKAQSRRHVLETTTPVKPLPKDPPGPAIVPELTIPQPPPPPQPVVESPPQPEPTPMEVFSVQQEPQQSHPLLLPQTSSWFSRSPPVATLQPSPLPQQQSLSPQKRPSQSLAGGDSLLPAGPRKKINLLF